MGNSPTNDLKNAIVKDDDKYIRYLTQSEIEKQLSEIVILCIESKAINCLKFVVSNFDIQNISFTNLEVALCYDRPACMEIVLSKINKLSQEQIKYLGEIDYIHLDTFEIVINHVITQFIEYCDEIKSKAEFDNNRQITNIYNNTINQFIKCACLYKNNSMIYHFLANYLPDIISISNRFIQNFKVGFNKPRYNTVSEELIDNFIYIYVNCGKAVARFLGFYNDNFDRIVKNYEKKREEYIVFLLTLGFLKENELFDIDIFIYELSRYIYHIKN